MTYVHGLPSRGPAGGEWDMFAADLLRVERGSRDRLGGIRLNHPLVSYRFLGSVRLATV
jgi:hypothetical protein